MVICIGNEKHLQGKKINFSIYFVLRRNDYREILWLLYFSKIYYL